MHNHLNPVNYRHLENVLQKLLGETFHSQPGSGEDTAQQSSTSPICQVLAAQGQQHVAAEQICM